MASMMTEKGSVAMMLAACRAASPPETSRMARPAPAPVPQMARCSTGGIWSPMESSVNLTSVPESLEVMK